MSEEIFDLSQYYHHIHMTVWFRDLDAMGHANNATYLSYLEQARLTYARDILYWNGDMHSLGMILGRVTMEYRNPLLYGENVQISTRISRLGNKSFDMLHVLQRVSDDAEPEVVATAITNMVAYDYAASKAIPILDDWRNRVESFEKGLLK